MIEAWKIGVSIAMTSNASQVLGALGRDLLGLGKEAEALTGKLNRAKVAAVGLMGVMVGTAGLSALGKLVTDYGQKINQAQSLMAQAHISQQGIANATENGYAISQSVRGTTPAENLQLIGDLRTVLGKMNEAIAAAPEMAKINVVLHNTTGQPAEKAGYEFLRFLELRGALVNPVTHEIDPTQLQAQARLGEAIIAATLGRVTPHDLLMFQQQAGNAGMSLTREGLIGIVPLIQAMGGARAGTALLSAQQQLLGSVQVYSHAVTQLERIGILDPNKIQQVRGGRYILHPGALAQTDLFRHDIRKWVNTVLIPDLQKHGQTTMDQMIAYVSSLGLRSTVSRMLVELIRNQPSFAKDVTNIHQAAGVDTYAVQQSTSLTASINNFKAAWEGLLQALGAPLVNQAAHMLNVVTTGLLKLEKWAADNPGLAKTIMDVAAGLSALAVLGGTLGIVAAALSGLKVLALPVKLLASAFKFLTGTLASSEAVAATTDLTGMTTAISGLAEGGILATVAGGLAGIATVLGTVGLAIAGFYLLYKSVKPASTVTQAQEDKQLGGPLYKRHPELVVPKSVATGHISAAEGEKLQAQQRGSPDNPVHVVVQNGKDIAKGVTHYQADQASKPKSGPTGASVRVSPVQPGFSTLLGAGVL